MAGEASADLSDFFAEQAKKGPSCTVGIAIAELPEKDAARLVQALATPALRHTSIAKWLDKAGYRVHPSSIGRHRQKMCGCG